MSHRGTAVACTAGAMLVAAASSNLARADEAAPPATAYPQALAERPLLLPPGAIEGAVRLTADNVDLGFDSYTFFGVEPRARSAFGPLELEAALALHLHETGTDDPRDTVQRLELAARYGLTADLALGVELRVYRPGADSPTYQPELVIAHKAHLSPRTAIETGAGLGVQKLDFEGDDLQLLVLEGRARAVAQLAPAVAAHALGRLQYLDQLGESMAPVSLGAYILFDVELGVTASLSPDLDAVASVDLLAGGTVGEKLFSAGVVFRGVP